MSFLKQKSVQICQQIQMEDQRFLSDILRTLQGSFQRAFADFRSMLQMFKKPLSSLTIYLRVSVQNLEVYLKKFLQRFYTSKNVFCSANPAFFNLWNVLESPENSLSSQNNLTPFFKGSVFANQRRKWRVTAGGENLARQPNNTKKLGGGWVKKGHNHNSTAKKN